MTRFSDKIKSGIFPDRSSSNPSSFLIIVGSSAHHFDDLETFVANLPSLENVSVILPIAINTSLQERLKQTSSAGNRMKFSIAREGELVEPGYFYLNTSSDHHPVICDGQIHLHKSLPSANPHFPIDALFQSVSEGSTFPVVTVILSGTGSEGTTHLRALKEKGSYIIIQDPGSSQEHEMPLAALKLGLEDAILNPEEMGFLIDKLVKGKIKWTNPGISGGQKPVSSDSDVIYKARMQPEIPRVTSKVGGATEKVHGMHFYQQLEQLEKEVMEESMKAGTTLKDVLDLQMRALENLLPGIKASILKIENDRMYNLASPSLPPTYIERVNGNKIGQNVGSCGSAAYRKEKVYVDDIENDFRWKNFKPLAARYGFKACWSQPIFNAFREVIATFAIYYDQARLPFEREEHAIERCQQLIALVFEKFNYIDKIQQNNERYEYLNKATNDAIYDWDVKNNIFHWGNSYTRIFGHPLDNRGFALNDWSNLVHPEEVNGLERDLYQFLSDRHQSKWSREYRYRRANNTYAFVEEIGYLIRNENGTAKRMIGVLRDISEKKELQKLLQRATQLSKVGGWEIDCTTNHLYWSTITHEIHEVGQDFNPKPESAGSFFKEGKAIMNKVFDAAFNGEKWDGEHMIVTAKDNEKWVRFIAEPEFEDGECKRIYGSYQDIHKRKIAELGLAKKTNYLSALTKIIELLFQSQDWYSTIDEVFKITASATAVDRIYYFENHINPEDGKMMSSQRFEWSSSSAVSQINNPLLQNLSFEEFADFFIPLSQNKSFAAIISKMPDSKLKVALEEQDIKTILVFPITINDHFWGFVGFDNCIKERDWTQDEISLLKSITSNLSVAIHRRKNQMELEKAYEEKNQILERIDEAFFALDETGKVVYWNRQAEKASGINRELLLGENLWDRVPRAKKTRSYKEYLKALKEQVTVNFEEYYTELGKWFEIHGYPSKGGISVFFRDITEKKKYLEALRQSNERFEKITEATQDAIWDWETGSDSLFWGGGFKTLFGYDPEIIQPTLDIWMDLIYTEDLHGVMEQLQSALDNVSQNHVELEYRFKKNNGQYAHVMDRGLIIRNSDGEAIRMVGSITDITPRKEYEETLKRLNTDLENQAKLLADTNEELEQFAYVASHDLQEPLRMVTGFLSQLEKKYSGNLDPKALQYIHFAVDGAKRMRQIILDLLEFSRVGKFAYESETIATGDIVHEICILQSKLIEEKNATIFFDNPPTIISYRPAMVQVFHNLISNSLKYVEEGTSPIIQIEGKEYEQCWEFSVKDNGIGIEAEYFKKIFVIFQRLHTKEAFNGTGIGLAIVKKIIENLGGRIWVESTPGEGSCFYFTLPRTPVEPKM